MVVKTDSLGQTQWARTIEGPADDLAESVIQLTDGTYIVLAYTTSFPLTKDSALLVKIDASGNVVWTRSLDI